MYFDQLPRDVVLDTPLQIAHRPVGSLATTVIDSAIALKLFPLNYLPYLFEKNAIVVEFI